MNFSTGRTVTPANAAVYIYDWILRLPNDHSRQPNEPHPAVKDKQAENDQAMQSNNEEDEFASEEFTSEERTQLMAEVNNVEEFVKLRKELGYDDADAGLQRLLACSQSSSSILGYVAALDMGDDLYYDGIGTYLSWHSCCSQGSTSVERTSPTRTPPSLP
ncbi:hypothetical protein IAS59_000612 [Cryptococcus gattii]